MTAMPLKVLVIEDNRASLDLMVYLLKAFGHTPVFARDGTEGIDAACRERPDLILCDIQLPGAVDGIAVCQKLRNNLVLSRIPIVAVTALAMVGDREKFLSEGFDGYISKPIDPETFIEQLAPYLRMKNPPAAGKSSPSPAKPVSAIRGTIMAVDNSQVNLDLARSLLEPFGYQIIEARGVDEAMQLLKQEIPDVILSDVHMPRKNGFDLIEEVKADQKLRGVPFIFITSTDWPAHEREYGLSLGAADYLIRPIAATELISKIEASRHKSAAAHAEES